MSKKWKKVLCVLMAAAMLGVAAVGCSPAAETEGDKSSSEENSTAQTGEEEIDFYHKYDPPSH